MSWVLGYDFGGTKVDIGIADHQGRVAEQTRIWVNDYPDLTSLLEASLRVGATWETQYDLIGVGVSSMGITRDDHVELAPNIPGWADLQLPAIFRRQFSRLPVLFDNDVRAACRAELRWGSLKGTTNAVYLNLGTGIAIALIIDGRVYAGSHAAAGEIAYLWRRGERGYRDGHAPFEESLGGGALDRTVQRQFPSVKTFRDLCDQIDDAATGRFVAGVFEEIAQWMGYVLLALDVAVVSVGGGIARQFATFEPIFHDLWSRYLPFPPALIQSRFQEHAGLYGGWALAVGPEDQP